MKIFKKIMLVITMFIFILPTIMVKGDENKKEDKLLDISYGIEGNYKGVAPIPFKVEVNNIPNSFIGEIQVKMFKGSGYYDLISAELSLEQGESKTVILPIEINQEINKALVQLVDEKGNVLEEKKVVLDSGRVNDYSPFIGNVTDDYNGLGYIGDVTYTMQKVQTTKSKSVLLDPKYFENIWENIKGLDTIVINDFNTASLTENHILSLNTWINAGGVLIVGTGVNESKTLAGLKGRVIDVNSNGKSNEIVNILGDTLNLEVSDLEVKNSVKVLESTGVPLAYKVEKGLGEVIVTTMDLGIEPMSSSFASKSMIEKLITPRMDEKYSDIANNGMYGGMYGNALNNIPISKDMSILPVVIIFIIYALIVGIIASLILKKINKRQYVWYVIPIVSILATILISVFTTNIKVKDGILNQVNIIDVDSEGNGAVEGYIGVANTKGGVLTIAEPEGLQLQDYASEYEYYDTTDSNSEKDLVLLSKTIYKDNKKEIEFNNLAKLQMKQLQISGKKEKIVPLNVEFKYSGKGLNGTIKNESSDEIKKLIIVSGNNVWDLGSVKSGEEKTISDRAEVSTSGLWDYSNILMNYHWDRIEIPGLTQEEMNDCSRIGEILNIRIGELSMKDKPYAIAITDKDIDYGIEVGKNNMTKFNTTCLIQDIFIEFKDKDGNYNYPVGYFQYDLGEEEERINNSNGYIDKEGGYVSGVDKCEMVFTISEDIDINEITLQYSSSGFKYMPEPGKTYVYNLETEEYDEISVSGYKSKITDKKYFNNNALKVKIVPEMGMDAPIPQISVKGRAK